MSWGLDVFGRGCHDAEHGPKTSTFFERKGLCCKRAGHDAGLASVLAGAPIAGCALRRQVLHRRAGQPRVLPLNLSGTHRERKELPVFPHGSGCGGSRLPSLSALSAGVLARNSGVVGHLQYSCPRVTPHQRERFGRRRCGIAGAEAGSGLAPSAAIVPQTSWCVTQRCCQHTPAAFRQEADRRNHLADEPRCPGLGLRLRTAFQCSHTLDIQKNTNSNPKVGTAEN